MSKHESRKNKTVLKNILQTKSNHVNTLHKLYDVEAELVDKLNFFNSNSELLEENRKDRTSIYSMKHSYKPVIKRHETQLSLNLPYISLRKSTTSSINKEDVLDSGRDNGNFHLRRLENLANENKLENEKKQIMDRIKTFKLERKTNTKQILALNDEIRDKNPQIDFLENFEKFNNGLVSNANLKNFEMIKNLKRRNLDEENFYFMAISKVKRDSQKRQEFVAILKEEIENFTAKKKNLAVRNSEIKSIIDELKSELRGIKNKLLVHYHEILKEGKDTRHDGVVWVIKAIWSLDENVILSNCPNFLDEKAIDYIFSTAKKEIDLQNLKNEIEEWKIKMRSYMTYPGVTRFSVFKTNIKGKDKIYNKMKSNIENKNFLELYENQSSKNMISINLKKIEEVFSTKNILNDDHKQCLFKLKEIEAKYEEEKSQIAITKKSELNRIGREFLLNDYKRRFDADLRTVISAIAGEDNINHELFKLERDKKDFMDKIRMCQNYNIMGSNSYKTE